MSTSTTNYSLTKPASGETSNVWGPALNANFDTIDAKMYELSKVDGGYSTINNLQVVASVAANALTVAIKTLAGTDPTATDYCQVNFRHATLTNGAYVPIKATSARSVVLSNGSTLGFTASEAGRIYVWAINNAGTLELALSRTADIFQDTSIVNTTSEGGAGAADDPSTMYSTVSRASVSCICIAKIDIQTGGTPGQWSSAPTKIQMMSAGVRRTGDVVQVQQTITGTMATGSTTIPIDNTIPQITEGDQYITQAITPTNSVNKLFIEASGHFANSATAMKIIMGLFQDSTANALAAAIQSIDFTSAGNPVLIYLAYQKIAGTASSTTFRIRAGGSAAGTITFNGVSGGALMGGVLTSYLRITEIEA